MTAVKGAGYISAKKPGSRGGSSGMQRPQGPSEAEICRELEVQVHQLMEDAAVLVAEGNVTQGWPYSVANATCAN